MTPPPWIDPEALAAFLAMRIRIKKPLSEYGMKRLFSQLEILRMAGEDPNESLAQSEFHSWQGVFPVKKLDLPKKSNGAAEATRAYLKAQSEIRPNAQIARAALSAVRRVK